MPVSKKAQESSVVVDVTRGRVTYCVLGETPLICNRMSEKSKGDLFFPPPRMNAAEKASKLKHDPWQEFRDSPYRLRGGAQPTFIAQIATAFKKAIMGAALDQPGTKKTQIGRLCYVNLDLIPVYGIPQIMAAVVRQADINHTPDVRTRACIPEWACYVDVSFAVPLLKEQIITTLLATAGQTQGVGDWRVEKGSGNFGQWRLVEQDNEEFLRRIETGGRAAQLAAMFRPESYDQETDDLLAWFRGESERRGFKVPSDSISFEALESAAS